MSSPDKKAPGGVEVRRPISGVLELVLLGHATAKTLDAANAELLAACEKEALRAVIFEGTGITSFDADVRKSGSALLSTMKRLGLFGIAALRNAPVRMLASTIVFASGIALPIVATREEALRLAESELSARPVAKKTAP